MNTKKDPKLKDTERRAMRDANRKARADQLAQSPKIRKVGKTKWWVPSHPGGGGHLVDYGKATCTCDDWQLRRLPCKHLIAIQGVLTVKSAPPDKHPAEAPLRVRRPTYSPQSWSAYNRAQCEERRTAPRLLFELCCTITDPPHPGRGRKPHLRRDLIQAMVAKVASGMSTRRATPDFLSAREANYVSRAPSYNAVIEAFSRRDLTALLEELIEVSAAVLARIETRFAVDSTGLTMVTYKRYFDMRYGREVGGHDYIKAHVIIGVKTGVIVSARITGSDGADFPQLRGLVETASRRFTMKQVSADKAYLGNDVLEVIESVGAVPFIPLKVNSRLDGSAAWTRLAAMFTLHNEEFLRDYHQRSNVEATFSAMKRLFGSHVRSKGYTAQVNEALCKCLLHNLKCLVHAIHELGIDPKFAPIGKEVPWAS